MNNKFLTIGIILIFCSSIAFANPIDDFFGFVDGIGESIVDWLGGLFGEQPVKEFEQGEVIELPSEDVLILEDANVFKAYESALECRGEYCYYELKLGEENKSMETLPRYVQVSDVNQDKYGRTIFELYPSVFVYEYTEEELLAMRENNTQSVINNYIEEKKPKEIIVEIPKIIGKNTEIEIQSK